ncbi:MAG: sigma-70 family RNA polymerase sigma factor [Oscillospiraceae bacterium]|nr:sigma-70 family RNA polymerase sigma factor [Oscillospiraceae bacterium]
MGGGGKVESIYLQNKEMVEACADKLCRQFHCEQLREDLISTGTLAVLTYAERYNPDSEATLSTFLYPYIIGAMKRELENSLYPVSLTKREFEALRVQGYLSFSSLDEQYDDNGELVVQIGDAHADVEQSVLHKIYLEVMEKEFGNLSFKEREILGGFFGAFGYEQRTLADLGEQFDLTENAATKAKDKALKKLTDACFNGEIGIWLSARKAIRKAQRDNSLGNAKSTVRYF